MDEEILSLHPTFKVDPDSHRFIIDWIEYERL